MGAHQRRKGSEALPLPLGRGPWAPEEWRDVVGHEGEYQVSSHGRVRSMDRRVPGAPGAGEGGRIARGTELRAWCGSGRPQVAIAGKSVRVLRLVAEAFLGPPPSGASMVCHIDGDGTNNHVSNLYWGTAKQNSADAVRHGQTTRGRGGKLTESMVREIRACLDAGSTQAALAARFGIHQVTVSEIKRRLIWGWLP